MNLFYKKTSDNKGFTLVEIIAVLIILGIMAAVAVSRVGSNQSDLIPQRDILKSHLRFAQLKALADDVQEADGVTPSSWGLYFEGTKYTLYNNGALATTSNLPGEDGKVHTFPPGVTVTTDAAGGFVYFNRWGSPVSSAGAGSTLVLTLLTANTTITLSQGGVNDNQPITITPNTGYITP